MRGQAAEHPGVAAGPAVSAEALALRGFLQDALWLLALLVLASGGAALMLH
jgi:hypothetical protein